MKTISLTLITSVLSGCVVSVSPSYVEQDLPQTKGVLMCPSVSLVYDIIQGKQVSNYCISQDVVAPGVRSYYEDVYQAYTIMKMGIGEDQYFWSVPYVIYDIRDYDY